MGTAKRGHNALAGSIVVDVFNGMTAITPGRRAPRTSQYPRFLSTLGANIGTCITALMALEIAFVHLLYNVLGVLVIYGIVVLRDIPVMCSEKLAHLASERKVLALAYVLVVFFVVPVMFMGASSFMP